MKIATARCFTLNSQINYLLTPSDQKIVGDFLKYMVLVTALILFTLLSIAADVLVFNNSIGEVSVTEISQGVLLFFTASRYFMAATKNAQYHNVFVLLGSFFLVLLIREQDYWFDHISHGVWVYPALIVLLFSWIHFFKDFKSNLHQSISLLCNPNMYFLVTSMLMLIVFTRLIGVGDFWKSVMSDNYVRLVKNICEEGGELLCYYLIALYSYLLTKKDSKSLKSLCS